MLTYIHIFHRIFFNKIEIQFFSINFWLRNIPCLLILRKKEKDEQDHEK